MSVPVEPLAAGSAESAAISRNSEALRRPVFYRIDLTKSRFSEYRRSASLHLALLAWIIIRVLRLKVPSTTDDPAVESLADFRSESLPEDVRTAFGPLTAELEAAGFHSPVFHAVHDQLHRTTTHLASFPHSSLPAVARIHLRTWSVFSPPRTKLYTEFITEYEGGEYLWSLSGTFDTDAPAVCRVIRRTGATPTELWAAHREELDAARRPRPVPDPESAATLCERLHDAVRGFHVERGLFAPRSPADEAQIRARLETKPADSGSRFAGVMAELARLQEPRGRGGALLLVVSLIAFLVVGLPGGVSFPRLLALVPMVAFHECGHLWAMKLCGYRNLRMFFIPGFGAAAAGQAYNVSGWKRVFVSLMGPVPGILLGVAIGFGGLALGSPLAVEAAFLLLVLNGFNLLPVLPLDGGHIAHTVLFSRHAALDAAFRIVAALCMVGMAVRWHIGILHIPAALLLLTLPSRVRLARVARQLRREGLPPAPPDDQRIPGPIAERIIDRLQSGAKAPVLDRVLAQQTLNVYEMINTRPPGWLASIGLLGVHLTSFLAAAVFAVVFVLGGRGALLSAVPSDEQPPAYALTELDSRTSGVPVGPQHSIVATYRAGEDARRAFEAVSAALGSGETVLTLGHTVFLRHGADNDSVRQRWVPELESRGGEVFVDGSDTRAWFRFEAVAPSDEAAAAAVAELDEYFNLPLSLGLVAPWSNVFTISASERLARQTLLRIEAGPGEPSAARDELFERYRRAFRRGDRREIASLGEQLQRLDAERKRQWIVAIASDQSDATDGALARTYLDLFGRLPMKEFYTAVYPELAPRLGQVLSPTGLPDRAWDPSCARDGHATRSGPVVRINVSFEDPLIGATELMRWLRARDFHSPRYEVFGESLEVEDEDDGGEG